MGITSQIYGSVSKLVDEQNLNFCIQLDVWVQVPPELQCDEFSNNFKVEKLCTLADWLAAYLNGMFLRMFAQIS